MKEAMNAREQKIRHGEYAINWVKEMVDAGEISIDKNGRPNIIRNEEDWEEENQEQEWLY